MGILYLFNDPVLGVPYRQVWPKYLDDNFAAVEGDITNLQTQITALQGDVATLNTEVATLNTEVTTLNTEVAAIQVSITNYGLVNVKNPPFNAVGNGISDDTTAIDTAIQYCATHALVCFFPPGVYRYTAPLTPILASSVTLLGVGELSTIRYTGATNNVDLITVGDGTNLYVGLSIRGLRFETSTSMTLGKVLRLRKLTSVELDISVVGNGLMYDGIWFDNTSTINMNNSRVLAPKNRGIIASDGSELHLQGTFISGTSVLGVFTSTSIHIGGGYGGVYTEQLTQANADIGMLVDTAITGTGNNQFFLTTGTMDGNTTAGAKFDDSISNPIGKIIKMGDGWGSGGNGTGLIIANWKNGAFRASGVTFADNAVDGLALNDPSVRVALGRAADISNNGRYGVSATAPITIKAPTAAQVDWIGNATANYQASVTPT